ncbi:uncharacterized protein [Procambarus clarkii]|uniref:uncharacterized protein isoform X2 n=1 Tax=Procambarus clarkii TaxID=6728 RepID=UPI001E676D76|nr:uncharacterized protein LOC123760143 isoform X1 [Procambarus clarkii]
MWLTIIAVFICVSSLTLTEQTETCTDRGNTEHAEILVDPNKVNMVLWYRPQEAETTVNLTVFFRKLDNDNNGPDDETSVSFSANNTHQFTEITVQQVHNIGHGETGTARVYGVYRGGLYKQLGYVMITKIAATSSGPVEWVNCTELGLSSGKHSADKWSAMESTLEVLVLVLGMVVLVLVLVVVLVLYHNHTLRRRISEPTTEGAQGTPLMNEEKGWSPRADYCSHEVDTTLTAVGRAAATTTDTGSTLGSRPRCRRLPTSLR